MVLGLLWTLIVVIVAIIIIIVLLKLVFAIIAIGPFAVDHQDMHTILVLVKANGST
jgi:hypothetical protein